MITTEKELSMLLKISNTLPVEVEGLDPLVPMVVHLASLVLPDKDKAAVMLLSSLQKKGLIVRIPDNQPGHKGYIQITESGFAELESSKSNNSAELAAVQEAQKKAKDQLLKLEQSKALPEKPSEVLEGNFRCACCQRQFADCHKHEVTESFFDSVYAHKELFEGYWNHKIPISNELICSNCESMFKSSIDRVEKHAELKTRMLKALEEKSRFPFEDITLELLHDIPFHQTLYTARFNITAVFGGFIYQSTSSALFALVPFER